MSAPAIAKLLLSQFGNIAQLVAAFAPVPALSPAVTVFVGIVQLCDNVSVNRTSIAQLSRRCEGLLLALRDECGKSAPDVLKEPMEAFTIILTGIRAKMQEWSDLGRVRSFVQQGEIADGIKDFNISIDGCIATYEITAMREIHNWQADYAANQKEDHQELVSYLEDISNQQALANAATQAGLSDVKGMLSLMQELLSKVDIDSRRHAGLRTNIYGVLRKTRQLLPNIDLRAGEVRKVGEFPINGGSSFDIWEGDFLGKEKCAIKAIRNIDFSPDTMRRFKREVEIWRMVWEQDRGRYILPFYGICETDGPFPYMVSPWMRHGNALNYVKQHKTVDRKQMVHRIAEGVQMLHSQSPPIAHGDLKCENILVSDVGEPLLADFGLSKILEDITGVPFTQSQGISNSYRWIAPELCVAPAIVSMKSDIFAFAMTALELMTGEQPFNTVKHATEVLIKMQRGDRPERPTSPEVIGRGLDDHMWNLLTRCWAHVPEHRPSIDEVLEALH